MLVDSFGRTIDYLRISVTDRCNLRCLYCMPRARVRFLDHKKLLRYEEILRLATLLVGLGVRKVRITGGEPLIRRNILMLFEKLAALDGLEELSLTTNGLLLGDFAERLPMAGIGRVNVSLDTLRADTFRDLTGSDQLQHVIDGVRAARQAGLRVKLNVVAMKGVNDDEYADFLAFAVGHGCDIRFIEVMPQMYNEPFAEDLYISGSDIRRSLRGRYTLGSPITGSGAVKERLYRVSGYGVKVGFISPISDPFCSTCNRLRLMSDGELKTCLFGEPGVNLRDLLRRGSTDSDLRDAVLETVRRKPEKHQIGCDDIHLVMHRTGG
jgi:cyclic pyranopterin phosphate synthase